MSFTITLNGQFDFSKCRGLAIRGFNKIKMYSTVYSHIKDCNAFDPVFIKPKTVIDAVGKTDPDRGIKGSSQNTVVLSKHTIHSSAIQNIKKVSLMIH